jgi:photosystem II stability/assembly factor-like uncharacterized protein
MLRADEDVSRLLLLDGCVVGNDVIVVGERGMILRSSDQARTWRRLPSPVKATLTGISFATLTAPRLGWAVGHDAVILASTDAGATWTKQYQGDSLEDSFLDVIALDAQRAIAVGAYGHFLITTNGGKEWTRRKVIEGDDHLNRITRGPGNTLYLAGEHGTLLRSPDLGANWVPLDTKYEGTFYGILPLERGVILAHGLRGRVFRSSDEGESWEQVATPRPSLLATALRLRSNQLVLGGQAGSLLVSRDLGRTLVLVPDSLGTGIAELLELPDGSVLALGEAGATRLEVAGLLPSPAKPPRRSP